MKQTILVSLQLTTPVCVNSENLWVKNRRFIPTRIESSIKNVNRLLLINKTSGQYTPQMFTLFCLAPVYTYIAHL